MDTIFGKFIERTIPSLKNAIIKILIGGKEAEMNLEDFKAAIVPEPIPAPYKVYTALLTQSGESGENAIDSGLLNIGVTYRIVRDSPGMDFTNVGAPNNDIGTYFVATGTKPNSWGSLSETGNDTISYNPGAPVVTVLENTIGNVWWTYSNVGIYIGNSNGLFTNNKTVVLLGTITNNSYDHTFVTNNRLGEFTCNIVVQDSGYILRDDELSNTPIEIRVYN